MRKDQGDGPFVEDQWDGPFVFKNRSRADQGDGPFVYKIQELQRPRGWLFCT